MSFFFSKFFFQFSVQVKVYYEIPAGFPQELEIEKRTGCLEMTKNHGKKLDFTGFAFF